jgi:hypothetical protein
MKTLRIVFSCGLLLFCLSRVQTVIPRSCTSEETITVRLSDEEAPAADAAKKWHLRYAKRRLRAERRKLLREVS